MATEKCTYCGNTVFLETAGVDGSLTRTCAGPLGCGVAEREGGPEPASAAAPAPRRAA